MFAVVVAAAVVSNTQKTILVVTSSRALFCQTSQPTANRT